jgi:hypothetical protein
MSWFLAYREVYRRSDGEVDEETGEMAGKLPVWRRR